MIKKNSYLLILLILCSIGSGCTREIEVKTKTKSEVLANLKQSPEKGFYHIDVVNDIGLAQTSDVIPLKKFTNIIGWAIDPIENSPAQELWVAIDTFMFQIYGLKRDRPDVAKVFSQPAFQYSGFHGIIHIAEDVTIPLKAELSMVIVNRKNHVYYTNGMKVFVEL